MDIRDWMNNNSAVVTIVAVLLLIVALLMLVNTCRGPSAPPAVTRNYYYDMNKNELFVGEANQIPPIQTESGPYSPAEGAPQMGAGVKAYVFACGDCSDPSKRFIGYLEMYTPEAKQKMDEFVKQAAQREGVPEMPPEAYLMYEEGQVQGRLIKRVDDPQWVAADTDKGVQIVNELTQRCPQGDKSVRLRPCFPAADE